MGSASQKPDPIEPRQAPNDQGTKWRFQGDSGPEDFYDYAEAREAFRAAVAAGSSYADVWEVAGFMATPLCTFRMERSD